MWYIFTYTAAHNTSLNRTRKNKQRGECERACVKGVRDHKTNEYVGSIAFRVVRGARFISNAVNDHTLCNKACFETPG